MDRREFFVTTGAALLASFALQAKGYTLLGDTATTPYGGRYLFNFRAGQQGASFISYDLVTNKEVSVPINFPAHTIIPYDSDRIFLTEKNGIHTALLDFKKGQIIALERIPYKEKEELFMGHGIYLKETGYLYLSQTYDYLEIHPYAVKGFISIRDPETLKEVGRFDSGGNSPHDMILNRGQFVVCNASGAYPAFENQTKFWDVEFRNLALLDYKTGKVINKIKMPNDLFCPSHMKQYEDHFIVTGINSHLEELKPFWWKYHHVTVVKVTPEYKTSVLGYPEYMKKIYNHEFLSIAVNLKYRIVGITNPGDKVIHFWNIDTHEFLAEIEAEFPKSITMTTDQDHFLVATQNFYVEINAKTLKINRSLYPFMGNGLSHSYLL